MNLRIVECQYTNPDHEYGVFYIGAEEIGRANKVCGGWQLPRKRKVLPAEMAAKAMLDGAISKARADEARARKLLEELRRFCGGRLPADMPARAAP